MILTLHLRPDVTALAVAVHPDAGDFEIYNVVRPPDLFYRVDDIVERLELPPGQYEIVGLFDEITKEQAAVLVAWEFDTCRDYTSPGEDGSYVLTNPTDALKSAIKANGGDPEANWLIIKNTQ